MTVSELVLDDFLHGCTLSIQVSDHLDSPFLPIYH